MTEEYLQKNEMMIREDAYPLFAEIDTIIFDIDGVLVDVNASYVQTIIDAVQYYFLHVIHLSGEAVLMNKKSIDTFKMMGGFNNDWELAAAAVLFYIWKMKEFKINSLEGLKHDPPLIADFSHKILSGGGGLLKLIVWVKENSARQEEIFNLWNREQVFQIAKEFYAGKAYCFRIYHFHPCVVGQVEGYMEKETILIQAESTARVRKYHLGILTGRDRSETEFILDQMCWNKWLNPEAIVTSESYPGKPSPEGIMFLRQHFGSRMIFYIGDTMDDLLTVENLNRHYGKPVCLSGLVLGSDFQKEGGKKEHYQKHNVDLLAEDVNRAIKVLDMDFK